jgi:hypothetical protein
MRVDFRRASTGQPDEEDEERADWIEISARGLARAYGDSEPEYSIADVIPEDILAERTSASIEQARRELARGEVRREWVE